MEYLLHIYIICAIFAALSLSLDLLVGHCGLLSVAHAAFFGIGAYSSAILAAKASMPFLLSTVSAAILAGLISLVLSLSSLRLHDDYFIIATFGFQMIVFSIFNNWSSLTNGPAGITGISRPELFGMNFATQWEVALLATAFTAATMALQTCVAKSPFGRVLRAIREDEILAQALGKNVVRFKVTAFVASTMLAGSAGAFFAHYLQYIDPSSFSLKESLLILSMVIVGGAGSLWGPILGATVLVALPEALKLLGSPTAVAASLREIVYGGLLVVMMMTRPRGLLGRYDFRRG